MQGLCPHTPTGEFPPQTPVCRATTAHKFHSLPAKRTASNRSALLATLTATYGGSMLSIHLIVHFSPAKVHFSHETAKHFNGFFSRTRGVCYQYIYFVHFWGAYVINMFFCTLFRASDKKVAENLYILYIFYIFAPKFIE